MRKKLIIALVVVVVAVPAVIFGWGKAKHFISVGLHLNEKDPLAYVEIVDKRSPAVVVFDKVTPRLDRESKARWNLHNFDARTGRFVPPVRALDKFATMPRRDADSLLGVSTNLESRASVRHNGALLMLWFANYRDAQAWLRADHDIFTGAGLDDERETYQVGTTVVYYSPSGAKVDQTAAVDLFVRQLLVCPRHGTSCALP